MFGSQRQDLLQPRIADCVFCDIPPARSLILNSSAYASGMVVTAAQRHRTAVFCKSAPNLFLACSAEMLPPLKIFCMTTLPLQVPVCKCCSITVWCACGSTSFAFAHKGCNGCSLLSSWYIKAKLLFSISKSK